MRSPREALRQLDLQVMLAESNTATIGPFLGENAALLAVSLGLTEHEVVALSTLGDEPLVFFLGPALRHHWARQKETLAARKVEQASTASQLLLERVRWHGDRAELDVSLLMGPLLSGPQAYVIFSSLDFQVGIARSKLREAARVLGTRDDLAAFVDPRGLHLRWRQGRGRLLLYPQPRPYLEHDALVVPLGGPPFAFTQPLAAE